MRDLNRFVAILRRLSEIALVGMFAFAVLLDVLLTAYGASLAVEVPILISGIVGTIAVILRRRWLRSAMTACLLASAAATAIVASLPDGPGFTGNGHPGMAEMGALLLLTITALRWVRPFSAAAGFAVAAMLALMGAAGRVDYPGNLSLGFVLFVFWSGAAAVGGYLRYQQERREAAVAAVRRAERLDIARELHDLVAHHITGIVVQAQAASAVAAQRPEAVVPALEAIAAAGGEALTAMRRLVSVLRSEDEAARTPGTALSDLRTLVDNFMAAGGPQVAFDIGQGVSSAELPPEVLTTLHRVLQESLTNIRKHAPGSTWVEVDLGLVSGGVRLRVRNYGGPVTDPRLSQVSRFGGGFGLVGMAERVEALGGTLTAGYTPEGAWEVCAVLKCDV